MYMVNKIFQTSTATGGKDDESPLPPLPKVLLISPPPIDLNMLKVHHRLKGTDREAGVTREYADAVLEVGKALKSESPGSMEVLDFHTLLFREASHDENAATDTPINLSKYLTDGLHMGPKVRVKWGGIESIRVNCEIGI